MIVGGGDWDDEPGAFSFQDPPAVGPPDVLSEQGTASLLGTALGAGATGAVERAFDDVLVKTAAAVMKEAMTAPAGEMPDWSTVAGDGDPDEPSWMGAVRQSIREATEATLLASIAAGEEWDTQAPTLLYPNCVEWVQHWLLPTYRRDISVMGDGTTWCPQWWEHPEAVVRFSALWRGFEQRRLEAGDAFSGWLRDHLDHHMTVLLTERGPFKHCTIEDGHNSERALKPLPMQDPPPGLAAFLG